ncbi:dTDP-4-dehydrorhamnose 3,5-epimerase [Cecembia lonarensis]|uniref:dTDP-4-dehydrorhamnose 3,5-epimerase n=1 Tax=Cecembia lonarensis (strain CCUG 58316 / KCTC 22772 / LW9) TaxID=1225176 RepID=K1KYW7_CECL9|nr:dTDP-4-dehydrorhamnose 3,5-epimerase [Cecembia lonarensis]EKB49355.1 dTDP-4-dehydrorhamnose 3,5-epimerase [Cecembia lonarensis LW9]
MKINKTPLEGVLEILPTVWEDSRGYFFESYRKDVLENAGVRENWVQENQSFSKTGTVRGLHFQKAEYAQAKLVRVITGKVLDVVLDIRINSPTFGNVYSVVLDAKLHNMLYIPRGFAHGFSVLEDAIFSYKCSNYYHKESEGGILWNDADLQIDWKVTNPTLSDRDREWPNWQAFLKQSRQGV